jgi:hypothetical protein
MEREYLICQKTPDISERTSFSQYHPPVVLLADIIIFSTWLRVLSGNNCHGTYYAAMEYQQSEVEIVSDYPVKASMMGPKK